MAAKIGVIHYNWPGYDLEGFLARATQIGFRYCELQVGDVWDGQSRDGEERAAAVRKLVKKYGMEVSALTAGNDFIQANPADLRAQVERCGYLFGLAAHLGTDVLRMDGGWNRNNQVPDQSKWDGLMLEGFLRCAELAEKAQVRMALDNHGVSTNDGDWQLRLIQRVGSKRLGVNLDTMNYRWFGHSLEKIDHFYQILAPHTFHVHLKDGTNDQPRGKSYKGAALGEGEIHLGAAVKYLKEAGYQGAWAAEYEGAELQGGVGYEKCHRWMAAHL
ncbi:MAG: sugar phosphate isomerase/epimerase [Candidatus Handelsmanbacteria bacterium]|nr:sugar phosphate isomerase/epimerase [Candidatus Handelsmanbacteria bacterium]